VEGFRALQAERIEKGRLSEIKGGRVRSCDKRVGDLGLFSI